MTFIEVVLASAMLGIVAAAMFSAYAFAIGTEAKEQQRLGAAELANRLVLNYLDSPSGLPDPHKTIDGGPGGTTKYRWEMYEEPVRVVEAAADQRDQKRESPLKNDRFRNVVVRVWLSEQSGGSRFWEANTPRAELSRMVDPIAPRNPDSYMAMIKNSGDFERLIQNFMGMGNVSVPANTSGNGFQRQTGGGSRQNAFGGSRAKGPSAGAVSKGSAR